MKRLVAVILALVMVLALCACGETPAPEAKAEASEVATTQPAEEANVEEKTEAKAEDNFPGNKPITIILPNGAGGSMEKSLRKWQPYFEEAIGTSVQLEFVEGSGTLIGTNVAANADPDGYTLLMLSGFDFCNTMVTLEAPYTMDNFEVLGINMQDATAIMVKKDAPWDSLQELLDYMKSVPEETVSMAVTNMACSDTLGVKELEAAAGIKFNTVAFNSGSKARTALIGGQADVGHFSLFGSAAILDDVKVLAIQGASNPFDRWADVPTVNEVVGQELHSITSDYGMLAPAGFKEQYPERYEKIVSALNEAWTNPDFLDTMKDTEEYKVYNVMNPEEATTFLNNLFNFVMENKSILMGE